MTTIDQPLDPYVDARPPDGACYCAGCIGMRPCDDDLCGCDEDDDGWFLDDEDWDDEEQQ